MTDSTQHTAGPDEPPLDAPAHESDDHLSAPGLGAHEPEIHEETHAQAHEMTHDVGHGEEEHHGNAAGHDHEFTDMKSTLLDAAELSNRAAGLAAKAGADLHNAIDQVTESNASVRIYGIVVLAAFAILMMIGLGLFGFMSMRLQTRITQADAMLLAVGKRVVAMDESIELLTDTGERLRDMAAKQDTLASQQLKNETRLEDVMRVAQSTSDALIKPPTDTKGPDLAKLLQALDARLQSQAAAIAALSSQTRAAAAPRTDTAAVRKEVEAMLRQQKAIEAAAKPVVVAPPVKPKENLVQYPRTQPQGAATP
jgi:hypothetical protein